MPTTSRCFTVRPTAAEREGLTVLVIDRSDRDAEQLCAVLREDGHVAEAHAYDDALLEIIAARNPQVIAIRMRLVGAARGTVTRVRQAFPHIRLITFNASTSHAVREQLPARWTDLYALSAARMPRPQGFPRAVRDALDAMLSA